MNSLKIFRRQTVAIFLSILVLAGQLTAQTAASASSAPLSGQEKELVEKIGVSSIKEMTASLSAPEMEGRGTGQTGGDKAANWIADKFRSFGLKPLGDKDSYLQKVDFKEITATPETTISVDGTPLKYGSEYASLRLGESSKNANGELVFISYGIKAKSVGIDQLEGVNLSGKIVVMIDGPPPGFPKEDWDAQNAAQAIFVTLLKAGVAGIITITRGDEERTAEENIQYLHRRSVELLEGPDAKELYKLLPPTAYVSSKGAEKLFAKSGITLKEAIEKSTSKTFKAMDLNSKVKMVEKYKVSKVSSSNVVGVLEGSDPALRSEAIVFSAHYDAYGTENGTIYPGAADNALGTAEMMAVAEAFSKLPQKPKRSMIFIAVTGEEYGLLGSQYWAKKPTWDVKKIAANLNLDGIGSEVYGPVKTIVGYGAEHSTLGNMLNDVAASYGINVIPDPMPDENVFQRSDHYSFVQRGIPSLMLLGAPAGEKEIWIKRIKDWEKTDYHNPGDTIKENWVWEGPETVSEIMAILGWRISENKEMPSWLPSSKYVQYERGNTKSISVNVTKVTKINK